MNKFVGISMSFAVVTLLTMSGCGGSDNSESTIKETKFKSLSQSVKVTKSGVKVFEPKDISFKSDCDYNCNDHGVITATTLSRWLDNWQENKPKGVEGRLIVLQAGVTRFDNNATFLPHNDNDVLVYGIPGGGACDPSYMRFDGISNTPGAMVEGKLIDRNINFFQIDPKKDFVVFAVAQGSTTIREITRTWWSMVYWGWDLKRLAFLNGSVEYNYVNKKNYLVAQPSPVPKMVKEYHMSDLKTDRTSLHIYIDEMKEIAKGDKCGIFLADARGTSEYDGTKASKSASKVCGESHDKQCLTAYRGHIRGAVDFPYTDILVTDDGCADLNGDGKIDKHDASYKFKNLEELESLYAQKGYKCGDTVVAYCRTGRKATITALTSVTVLGYPFRMYDGSWMQWGMMANSEDTNGTTILSSDSKQRTDTDEYSVVIRYNDSIDVNPAEVYKIDLNSNSSQTIKEEDKEYLKN